MIAPELITYINNEKSKGTFSVVIKNNLKTSGWVDSDVEQAFSQIEAGQLTQSVTTIPASTVVTSSGPVVVSQSDKPKRFDFKNFRVV